MLTLPPPLRSGDPINTLVPWAANVIDYLRAITVRPSATVSVATTANGTLLTAAGKAGPARGGYAYAGEFALFLDGTTLKVSKGTVFVNGNPVAFQDDITACSVANIGTGTIRVYLCAYQTESPDEARSGMPVHFGARIETRTDDQAPSADNGSRGYIELGQYSAEGGIEQKYLGGTGSQIVVGPAADADDNMIFKWNDNTKTWQAAWLTPIA